MSDDLIQNMLSVGRKSAEQRRKVIKRERLDLIKKLRWTLQCLENDIEGKPCASVQYGDATQPAWQIATLFQDEQLVEYLTDSWCPDCNNEPQFDWRGNRVACPECYRGELPS